MRRVLAIGAVAAALGGCGTVQNFQRGSIVDATVYGGVDIAADRLKAQPQDGREAMRGEVDVALSAVGDTATLPITITTELIRAIRAAYYCTPQNAQPNPQRPPPPPLPPPLPPPSTSAAPPQPGTSTAPPPHGPP
ncbi:hypothetical protein [Frigoriglobus tundricola]|uniref:Porphobilinogen deaminase n=1 Tax=Frigoriglobus tundricola TaxID=2774151 RepID=A0A6M5YX91_9BACT|nr:hypothetical protein [Frigoriglobus tundricola]QJW97562.1 Porphobilinogen deaminase [Frigoriglobus tundricola]